MVLTLGREVNLFKGDHVIPQQQLFDLVSQTLVDPALVDRRYFLQRVKSADVQQQARLQIVRQRGQQGHADEVAAAEALVVGREVSHVLASVGKQRLRLFETF